MGELKLFLRKLHTENLFRAYLPIFRVYLAFHIIKKIYLNWGASSWFLDREIYTSKYANLFPSVLGGHFGNTPAASIATIILALMFGLGIGRNIVASLLFFAMIVYYEPFVYISNGGDNLLYFILLYMVFTNSYSYLALAPQRRSGPLGNLISNLGAGSIVLHLCLIYFVSGVHKVHADVWLNGVATYYILQLDRFSAPINQFFVKNSFIIAATTYGTLLLELLFPFLVWNKFWRPVFLIGGILMHLGIYFTMMIYDFEILFIAVYGFFISNKTWDAVVAWVQAKTKMAHAPAVVREEPVAVVPAMQAATDPSRR